MIGCCSCFGFDCGSSRRQKRQLSPTYGFNKHHSLELLLDEDMEDDDECSHKGDVTDTPHGDVAELHSHPKCHEEILRVKEEKGMMCRQNPVRETNKVVRLEDENGNKMVNEYVLEYKIGAGSYGKVVLYRSSVDRKHYAIKAFHKSHFLKLRVSPSETAMTDVLQEVLIMKMLDHPNIVDLIEVIDDPQTNHLYMVLEYVGGKWVFEDSGPQVCLEETTARKYLQDIVSGFMYLHAHDDNDELRRSPGTPVFIAPECCIGLTYCGKAADTWAVGVTLYCMILGQYPFLGETLQDTYEKIVNSPLVLPDDMNPGLKNLLEGLLCKDPNMRMTLETVAKHSWVIWEDVQIPHYLCWCKQKSLLMEEELINRSTDERMVGRGKLN